MPTPKKEESGYKKHLSHLKDFVYVIGLVIALTGWITTKTKSAAILETTVKNNTETLEKVETFITNQATLNGKFLQHMEENSD